MSIKLDAIEVGRVFAFKGGPRRVTKFTRKAEDGWLVHWEYADDIPRSGRRNGTQSAVHFRRAALQEIPDWWRPTTRQLRYTGREVPALNLPVPIQLRTACPAKWAIVDQETGHLYGHDGKDFRRLSVEEVQELADFLQQRAAQMKEDQLQLSLAN